MSCRFDLITLSVTELEDTTSYNVASAHLTSKNCKFNQNHPQQYKKNNDNFTYPDFSLV